MMRVHTAALGVTVQLSPCVPADGCYGCWRVGPCKIGFRRTVGHSKMARYPIQTHPSASSGLDPLLDRIWSKPALLPHLASASASNAPLASAGAVKALQAPTTVLQASPTSGWTQAAVRVYRGGADGVLSATEYPVAQFCPQATAADVGDARGADCSRSSGASPWVSNAHSRSAQHSLTPRAMIS